MARVDETWHRLREWTAGQAPSERLAAHVLRAEGYTGIDPSHPLGGPDGGRDAIADKDGRRWVMAVYFPRGRVSFADIRNKVRSDYTGVATNEADGMVFVTNQELTLDQRKRLLGAVAGPLELLHLERLTRVLDTPGKTLPAALVIGLLQAGLVYELSPAAANVFFVIAFAWSWLVLDELSVRKRRREGRWP